MARRINAVAFAAQLAEQVIGPDSLVEVAANRAGTVTVWVKVPFNLSEGDTYGRDLAAATTAEDTAKEALSHYPGATAEEQWATWTEAGHDAKLLINIVGNLRQEAEDRAKNFRYRG